jgi:hypothetical protein
VGQFRQEVLDVQAKVALIACRGNYQTSYGHLASSYCKEDGTTSLLDLGREEAATSISPSYGVLADVNALFR